MLKERILALTLTPTRYSVFFSKIRERLGSLELFTDQEKFLRSAVNNESGCHPNESSLIILFVEYPHLDRIDMQVLKDLHFNHVILISFYPDIQSDISKYPELFDFIPTQWEAYPLDFFFNKLQAEIASRNKISLLQFEVSEFYEIGKSLSSEKNTMKLFEMIINSSLALTSSDAGTIYIVTDQKTGNWSPIKNGVYKDKLMKFILSKNLSINVNFEASTYPITRESIYGYTVITGKTLRIDDVYSLNPGLDYRHNRSFDMDTGYITRSILSTPMKDHKGHLMGVIQLINKKKKKNKPLDFKNSDTLTEIIPYDYTDEALMNSLAGQAAIALENNLLYRDMNDLLQSYKQQNKQLEYLSKKTLKAHEDERKRIAREIHDGPAQAVVNLSFKLEVCKKLLQNTDLDRLSKALDDLNTNIRGSVKEIRSIIYDLKPAYLDDGLIKALENHLQNFMDHTGLNIEYRVAGDDSKIESYVTSAVYRMVQEALTNTHKHANARNVKVTLKIRKNELHISISDDGVGFDTTLLQQKNLRSLKGGFGVEGMKERAELIKGSVAIDSTPGKGTMLTISIPL